MGMKEYVVYVKEVLMRPVFVQAEDDLDAINKVEMQYHNEEIVLGSEDLVDATISTKDTMPRQLR